MLNELYDLAQSLKAAKVKLSSWHRHFKPCPKGSATFFVFLNSQGQVSDLEPIADRERLEVIRKWEVEAGVSFPAFNVLPLHEPSHEDAKKLARELRKAIASKTPPNPEEIRQRIDAIVSQSKSLWVEKESARITKCLRTLSGEIGELVGIPPDEFLALSELIARSGILTSESLHQQLAPILLDRIITTPRFATNFFDAIFFHSGKTAKKWSLIPELADRSEFDFPVNHVELQFWINSRMLSTEKPSEITDSHDNKALDTFAAPANRIEETFPAVRLSVLGNVILRSMSSESPCQRRYGYADSQSCRVGQTSRQDMKNALEWIAHADRRDKTWCDVTSLSGQKSLLFAYPSQLPKVDPELAGLIVGFQNDADPDGAKFSACANRVTATLTDLVRTQPHESAATEIRVFVLTKPDGFRTKVLFSGRYSVEHLLSSANEWMECCQNIPRILIRQFGDKKGDKLFWADPFIPYPAEVVSCLNTFWARGGTHPQQVPGFGIGDALGLLLEEGIVLKAIATRAIRTLVTNSLSLVLALGQAHQQGLVHRMSKTSEKQSLLLPSVLGLLLAKLDCLKGHFMKGPPFLVGRLLSLADQLHLQYCKGIRKGQVPPQLMGNALVTTAMDSPVRAVALIWQRIKPYYAWAQTVQGGDEVRLAKWLLGELSQVSTEMSELPLPTQCTDSDRAEMLLGYLARPEKQKDASTTSEPERASA